MLLKYLKSGAHDEPGGLRYLLKNDTATVLRGDPAITQRVIDHSPPGMRQRFTSGVINDLSMLDKGHDEALLDELESLHLLGRPKSSMAWCVIEHIDKGRREIHFVIPLFDLLFRKWVHPYLDRIDRHAFQAWVEHFALRHNLDLPHEKLRVKPPFEHLRIREVDRDFLEEIWNLVHGWVKAGTIKSRADLERQLTRQGYKVRFQKHGGGELQQPVIIGTDGNSLRLANSVYYRPDFGDPCAKPLDRSDKIAVAKRLDELNEIVRKWRHFRAFHMIGRLFGKAKQTGVEKGAARKRLKKLIDARLVQERLVGEALQRTDFSRVFTEAYHLKTGVPTVIPKPKDKVISQPVAVGKSEKSVELSVVAEIAEMSGTLDMQAMSPDQEASAEPFQPPTHGENPDTGCARQKSTHEAAPVATPMAIRRRRRRDPEVEPPSL